MTCPHSQSDGAYVLGALSPAERTAYEAHLAGCEVCATAVARLAPVPGLLGRVDSAALNPEPAGPARLPELLRAVTTQRRRQSWIHRWRLAAAAAAAAVLAVAGTAVWSGVAGDGTGPDEPMLAMEPVAAEVPVAAQLAMEPTGGGTTVWMDCQYPPVAYEAPAKTFRLVAYGDDGTAEQLASWWAAPGDEVSLSGLTRYTGDDLARIELHGASGAVLLAYQVD